MREDSADFDKSQRTLRVVFENGGKEGIFVFSLSRQKLHF